VEAGVDTSGLATDKMVSQPWLSWVWTLQVSAVFLLPARAGAFWVGPGHPGGCLRGSLRRGCPAWLG